MIVHQSIDARAIATHLAAEVRNEPAVRELWMHETPEIVDLWLFTDRIDDKAELALYQKSGRLYEVFPEGRFRVHILHPEMFADGVTLRSTISRDARRFPLSTQ